MTADKLVAWFAVVVLAVAALVSYVEAKEVCGNDTECEERHGVED